MANDNYEYECMRADLLGLEHPPKPNVEESVHSTVVDPENLELSGEQIGRTSNGLDELNSIIASTKKKLTRYQRFCGRLGSIMSSPKKGHSSSKECFPEQSGVLTSQETNSKNKISDEPIEREVERQVDKLDAMLLKMEKAEFSLNENNKLIRKVIKK